MRCEVCGHKIYGKSYKVMIEGAKLMVCNECSKHGKIIWEEPRPKPSMLKPVATLRQARARSRKPPETTVDTTQELAENFGSKARQARERLGLSHEELGKRINEKVSVLKKVEAGKMTPNNILAVKLEHALKIKLLVPASKERITQANVPKIRSQELTLGDLVQLSKKREEDSTERKRS